MVVKHGSVPRRWKRILSQLMFRLINYSEARVTRHRKREKERKEGRKKTGGGKEMGLQGIFSESRKECTRGGGEACTALVSESAHQRVGIQSP